MADEFLKYLFKCNEIWSWAFTWPKLSYYKLNMEIM